MANKIKYGLKNVHYAKTTLDDEGKLTFAKPVPIQGAVSLSLDPQGNTTKFYADNIVYWTGIANNGYEGELEIARVPESFEKDILGVIEDAKNVAVETADAPTVSFALLFQFEGDAKAVRHVLYNCTAARPNIEGNTTNENVEPETETLELTAATIYNESLDKDIVKANTRDNTDSETYSKWYETVYLPTSAGA